ncbi:MAG TPA: energy transducer TonB [Allosphingosinicella sp.]|nr:energy transducer TonB [Allosphingosinicella sp.]
MSPALLLAATLAAQGNAAPAAAAATPVPPSAAPPRPTDWPLPISDDDYPAAAIRGDEEGKVRYRLDIGADGRVARCTVTGSSGSATLDSATCRIVTRRARFAPARDSQGNAIPDARDGEVTWRLGEQGDED